MVISGIDDSGIDAGASTGRSGCGGADSITAGLPVQEINEEKINTHIYPLFHSLYNITLFCTYLQIFSNRALLYGIFYINAVFTENIYLGVFMKIKRFLLCFGLFAVLFCSCELLLEIGDILLGGDSGSTGGSGPIENPTNAPSRKFYAQNLATNSFYQLEADLMAESQNCRVWAEKGAGVTVATANSMARAYEEGIRPKMLDTFSYNGQIGYNGTDLGPIDKIKNGKVVANNTLELAGWINDEDEDGDRRLNILLLDIKDSYKPRDNESYCAGYFWAVNFYGRNPSNSVLKYSNECSMIYVDTYPGVPGSEGSNTTVAHELQHLMTFVNAFISDKETVLDTWVDEGLSSAAEWLYLGKQVEEKMNWYNSDRSGLIQKGNNFFVWDNREKENQYANLDDYSTVYLFFQWLRLQSGSKDIYREITMSNYHDHLAVTSAANKVMKGNGYDDWETLLKTWLAANYINAPSGPYGYKNDSVLKNVKAKTAPRNTSISLYPGEGVYSITNNFNMPAKKQSIRYAGLDKSGKVSDTATFSGGALLTYNVNTNIEGKTESGTTTGVASYAEADAPGRSAVGISFTGPYAIGAGDMLRRNGFEGMPSLELTRPVKGITVLE